MGVTKTVVLSLSDMEEIRETMRNSKITIKKLSTELINAHNLSKRLYTKLSTLRRHAYKLNRRKNMRIHPQAVLKCFRGVLSALKFQSIQVKSMSKFLNQRNKELQKTKESQNRVSSRVPASPGVVWKQQQQLSRGKQHSRDMNNTPYKRRIVENTRSTEETPHKIPRDEETHSPSTVSSGGTFVARKILPNFRIY